MLIKVFSVQGCVGGGATGLLNKGGGSNRLPGLVKVSVIRRFHCSSNWPINLVIQSQYMLRDSFSVVINKLFSRKQPK